MKVGRQSKVSLKSFEERIKGLKQEIELLEELIPIYEYFKLTIKYRNSYIVEVRRIIAKELLNKGISYSEVGRTLSRDHTTIMHLMTVENTKEIQEIVALNYKQWIVNKLCPITFTKMVPSSIHPNGWRSTIDYELKQL